MIVTVKLDDRDWACVMAHLQEARTGQQVKSQIAHGAWAEDYRIERDRISRIRESIRLARKANRRKKAEIGDAVLEAK